LVTSWKPCASARRPLPWQLGQVVVRPNEFPMRRSPPQTPQTSSFRCSELLIVEPYAIRARRAMIAHLPR
jgi:hypothetical protein